MCPTRYSVFRVSRADSRTDPQFSGNELPKSLDELNEELAA